MPFPMVGAWNVRVTSVRPFTIHGDEYLELQIARVDDASVHLVRVPKHALKVVPAAGDQVSLTFLMGQVTEVR